MLKQIGNLYLLGTAHVSKESSKLIKKTIEEIEPEVVGIELDMGRLQSLLSKKKAKKPSFTSQLKQIGFGGYIFAKVGGYVQEKIAKSLGVESGIDMKTAYIQARKHKIPTALIDQDIRITLKKFSKISMGRKIKLFGSIFLKSFSKKYKNVMNFDINKGIPNYEKLEQIIGIVKTEAPDLYKILIHERNEYMVNKLLELKQHHEGPILAVVGAGHLPGMVEILNRKLATPSRIEFSIQIEN